MFRSPLTRLPLALAAVAAAAALSACASPARAADPAAPHPPEGFEITDVDLGGGQWATCITWESGNGHEAGLDCQWPDREAAVTVSPQRLVP